MTGEKKNGEVNPTPRRRHSAIGSGIHFPAPCVGLHSTPLALPVQCRAACDPPRHSGRAVSIVPRAPINSSRTRIHQHSTNTRIHSPRPLTADAAATAASPMSAPHPIAVAARPQPVAVAAAYPTDPASTFAAAAAAGAISVTAIRVQPTAGQQWDGAAATMQAGPSGAAAASPAAASSSSSVASRRRGYWYWQRWPGRNQPFGCFGHVVLLARDHATLLTNVAIILVNGAVFLALVARHVHAAVVAVGVIITAAPLLMLALTTFTEPGIIPRKKLSDYPSSADPVPGNNGSANEREAPVAAVILFASLNSHQQLCAPSCLRSSSPLYPAPTGLLENIEVPLKWCKTCAIWSD